MKKIFSFFKNWKFILIVSILVLYGIYVSVLFKQDIKLPSENWSRALSIEKLKPEFNGDIIKSNHIFTVPNTKENQFITLWYHKDKLNYTVIDNVGNTITQNSLKLQNNEPEQFKAVIENDLIKLYNLEENSLKLYTFNWKTNDIISSEEISKNVENFKVVDDLIIYSDNNSLNIVDNDKNNKFENINVKSFQVINDNDMYYIAAHKNIERANGELLYLTYDRSSKEINNYLISEIPFMSSDEVDLGLIKDNINVVVPSFDNKNNRVVAYLYEFQKDNPLDVKKSFIRVNGNPNIIKSERDNLKFIASDTIMKGSKVKTINFVLYTLENGKIIDEKLLTKTDKVSSMPNFFSLGEDKYLQWIDKSGMKKTILFSSSNENIIKTSEIFTVNEWIILIFNTLLSLLGVLFMSIMPVIAIMFPIIIIIILAGAYKIYWMEKNPIKIFIVSVILHNIAKTIYIFYVLSSKANTVALPSIFINPLGVVTIIGIGTLIALYCTVDFIKHDKNRKHFLGTYVFYAIADITLLSLMIYPYIYSFMAFGYLTNM